MYLLTHKNVTFKIDDICNDIGVEGKLPILTARISLVLNPDFSPG